MNRYPLKAPKSYDTIYTIQIELITVIGSERVIKYFPNCLPYYIENLLSQHLLKIPNQEVCFMDFSTFCALILLLGILIDIA